MCYSKCLSRADQHASLVDGLREATAMLEASGITLVIEPLNELIDHQGYYLVRSQEAFQVIEEVGFSECESCIRHLPSAD